ncbi:SDR family NAD(P)-dependent oxidoreductase [Chloroflexota bacterium]
MQLFDLSNKVAIVTGGSKGIGFALTRALGSAGASVIIANRTATEGQKAASLLQKEKINALAIPTHVDNLESIDNLTREVVKKFGRIDILVNNAAFCLLKPPEEFSEKEWDQTMDINMKSMFFCCQRIAKEMMKQKKGKIINLSSLIIGTMRPGRAVYAISKGGVAHLTRTLAFEWGKYNINVNAIAPGLTLTDINREHFEKHPDEFQKVVSNIPLGREANVTDYMGTVVYLASDASDYMTGQVLVVDGGSTVA